MGDDLSEHIYKIIKKSEEPYETKEVIEKLDREDATRVKVLDRLKNLRGVTENRRKASRSRKGRLDMVDELITRIPMSRKMWE